MAGSDVPQAFNNLERRKIMEIVERHNATTISALRTQLGVSRSTIRFHLAYLTAKRLVECRRVGNRLVYSSPGADVRLVVSEHPLRRLLLETAAVRPAEPLSVLIRDASEATGRSCRLLYYHADRLRQAGLLATVRMSEGTVGLASHEPEVLVAPSRR